MKSTIQGSPSFSHVVIDLGPGESVVSEAGAMQSMSAELDMKAVTNGGFFPAVMKKFFGAESFFVNRFTNNGSKEMRLVISQDVPGEIVERLLSDGEELCLQRGAYLAATEGVKFKTAWAGFASWFGGEGLIKLKASGSGTLWYGAYGGIIARRVEGDLKVDDGHLVAYDPSLKLKVALAGGLFASLFGGEGFVTRVVGSGTVYIQTRSVSGLAAWLNPNSGRRRTMKVEVVQRPANSAAKITLAAGENCTAEGGAMIAMSGDMNIETKISKGEGGAKKLLKGLARRLGGEGIFMNHYTAGSSGGELYLATSLPGDMQEIELDGSTTWNVQNGSFVAHSSSVGMNISWGGFKNVFSGENLIWLRLSGTGLLVISAFGALYSVDVDGEYIVDTGNIAAFEDTLEFSISKAGKSWVSSFVGGEGLVCRFKGKGRIWCQTHADKIFGAKLTPHLVPKKN